MVLISLNESDVLSRNIFIVSTRCRFELWSKGVHGPGQLEPYMGFPSLGRISTLNLGQFNNWAEPDLSGSKPEAQHDYGLPK